MVVSLFVGLFMCLGGWLVGTLVCVILCLLACLLACLLCLDACFVWTVGASPSYEAREGSKEPRLSKTNPLDSAQAATDRTKPRGHFRTSLTHNKHPYPLYKSPYQKEVRRPSAWVTAQCSSSHCDPDQQNRGFVGGGTAGSLNTNLPNRMAELIGFECG